MRFNVRKKVDFPHPDGPISAVTSSGRITRFTPSSTFFSPNQQDTFRAESPRGDSMKTSPAESMIDWSPLEVCEVFDVVDWVLIVLMPSLSSVDVCV